MRFLFDLAIAVAVAAVLGLSTAWYAVDRGVPFGSVAIGDWIAWPDLGSANADPYSIAMLARSGEVPLGTGEGLAFEATVDHQGRPLSGNCRYRVSGQTPPARMWTLAAYDATGKLMATQARRQGFHSREILRRPDGGFDIVVSTEVAPANWLPIAGVDRFKLVFRLYDTPLTTSTEAIASTMPDIIREACS